MAQPSIATAADYADAMLTARRAKNCLIGILLIVLLLQLGLFFGVHYSRPFREALGKPAQTAAQPAVALPTSQPLADSAVAPVPPQKVQLLRQLLEYFVGLTGFAGIVSVLVLVGVLALLVQIMLVGRLIGVSLVTQSLIGAMLLAVLLFPWQAFLNNADLTAADFKIPGVLYTWNELVRDGGFATESLTGNILKWGRFVGVPFAALVITLVIQIKSNRGLGMALGEIPIESEPLTSAESASQEPPNQPEQ